MCADENRYLSAHTILRADVWDASDKHCAYCRKALHPLRDFCIDHVIPKCAGGTDDLSNLVAACRLCNNRKGSTADRKRCSPGTNRRPSAVSVRGDYLQTERLNRGWSANHLSQLSGVSRDAIRKAEAGGILQMFTVKKIAAAMDVPPSRLIANWARTSPTG